MRTDRSRGFTLIELLVVIAIIAILAAILFPVFLAARESSRATKCASNLSNIGRALAMYREDYGGRNCYIWGGGDADDQGCFYWVITRYVGQKMDRVTTGGDENKERSNVYKCPSAMWLKQQTEGKVRVGSTDYTIGRGSRLNVGFAYTMNETGFGLGPFAGGRLMDSQFRRPSQTIFVGEEMGWVSYGIGVAGPTLAPVDNNQISGPTSIGPGWTSRNPDWDEDIPMVDHGSIGPKGGSWCKIYNLRVSHSGGANFMFYDGHMKLMRTTKGRNWSVIY